MVHERSVREDSLRNTNYSMYSKENATRIDVWWEDSLSIIDYSKGNGARTGTCKGRIPLEIRYSKGNVTNWVGGGWNSLRDVDHSKGMVTLVGDTLRDIDSSKGNGTRTCTCRGISLDISTIVKGMVHKLVSWEREIALEISILVKGIVHKLLYEGDNLRDIDHSEGNCTRTGVGEKTSLEILTTVKRMVHELVSEGK
ncbi:Hypothetical predicted protein [Mytilus galloprovincialis]|uniref:Uncharacterized protein n=1 Tax=Mytilus galloprovincialis TaxID=29158 RepID=A0A8B6FJQ5_MYTGA|nr:Hypothetical predicted protein [Mytilus galloprovincialis]